MRNSEENKRLRGEGFGKRFSKKWWTNFWFYYKTTTIIIVLVLIVGGYSVYEIATKVEIDTKVDYFGYHGFTEESMLGLHSDLSTQAIDINGDGETVLSFYPYAYSPSAKDEQSLSMSQKLDLELAVDECAIFFMDRDCLDRFGVNTDYFVDITEIAAEYGVSEENLIEVDGKNIAVSLAGSKLLEKHGMLIESDGLIDTNVYFLIRERRYNETKGEREQKYDHSMKIAEYILASSYQ